MFSIQVIFHVVCYSNVTGLKQEHPTPFLIVDDNLSDMTSETSQCSWDTAAQVNVDLASEASFRKSTVKKQTAVQILNRQERKGGKGITYIQELLEFYKLCVIVF